MIPNGAQGTRATLKIMGKIAKDYSKAPAIRDLALSLVRHLPNKKWLAEVKAIHQYVIDNIRYTKDIAGCETLQTPIQTLKLGQGDCDDHSMLVGSLLLAIGHPIMFVAVGRFPGQFQHVYTETKIAGKWVPVETTENWPVGRGPKQMQSRMEQHV